MIEIYQVDAFTDKPFAGNPAAVCLLKDAADADWMQSVAAEMNLSETAFLVPQVDGFDLRWFTPAVEVDLSGHATLASAHVLWETGKLAADGEAPSEREEPGREAPVRVVAPHVAPGPQQRLLGQLLGVLARAAQGQQVAEERRLVAARQLVHGE